MKNFFILTACFLFSIGLFGQVELTNEEIFLAYQRIQGEQLQKNALEPFLERYHKKEYELKTQSKSAKKAYLAEQETLYNNKLKSFNLFGDYTYTTSVNLKDYDIAKGGFNVEILDNGLSRGKINPIQSASGKINYIAKATNFADFQFLKMDKDKVIEVFVNSETPISKDSIDIVVHIEFYKVITNDIMQFGSSKMFFNYAMCKITKVVFKLSDKELFIYKG